MKDVILTAAVGVSCAFCGWAWGRTSTLVVPPTHAERMQQIEQRNYWDIAVVRAREREQRKLAIAFKDQLDQGARENVACQDKVAALESQLKELLREPRASIDMKPPLSSASAPEENPQ